MSFKKKKDHFTDCCLFAIFRTKTAIRCQYWYFGRTFYTRTPGKPNANSRPSQNSPGVEDSAVEQSAVEMVAHKVSAHHRAFAVFGSGDGFGDDQVGFVPHIQKVDVKHQSGICRNYIACKHG